MPPFPIDRYLLPETPVEVPDGFTEVRQSLTAGLPHRVELGAGVHAVLILPTGLARQWLATDPLAVVSTSADDLAPRPAPAATPRPPALVGRVPLRLVVRQGTRILGSVPLAAGLRRVCPDAGPSSVTPSAPVAVEVVVLAWLLHAGTVRGSGDYGSSLTLAWRPADRAADHFGPPPINEFVWRRRPPAQRVESELGPGKLRYRYLLDKKMRRVLR
ncbi:hypothetical protein F8271_10910 [Micromonospora sp. ALFpr18c]|uniref:hypothetical protein n=1 Tax=Micromonospora sp. ALFpr18c TaxID=1458665 RepID=UPI00124BA072|nr:hypothetical protein [Micromonospora sp. ALFpr18c]KAB1942893.1 hypothetical protein F8271_10910 [Micromonospora sp. ALFpr18c]